MQVVSEYRKRILVGVILAVIIASGLAVSAIWFAPKSATTQSSIDSPDSQLIVQLTDPPAVPQGTTSLKLTYSQIDLLIAEPGLSSQSVAIIPNGGSATVDLLKLENVSQTLASANLPGGSELLSASFVVSSIAMEANGTSYPVTLATGGNTLVVNMTQSQVLQGTNALLLQFNPSIINDSNGFQLVPSSLGVFKPQSELTSNDSIVGFTQTLSVQDQSQLHKQKGSITANLMGISVSGTTTTISVQVTNTG